MTFPRDRIIPISIKRQDKQETENRPLFPVPCLLLISTIKMDMIVNREPKKSIRLYTCCPRLKRAPSGTGQGVGRRGRSLNGDCSIQDNGRHDRKKGVVPMKLKTVLGLMLVTVLAFPLFAPAAFAEEEAVIEIDAAHFPDPAFRACLAEFDRDGNGSFSTDEIMEITFIHCGGKGIASAAGIEYFAFLEDLNISENPVARLELGGNPELKELRCSGCELTELDVSGNPGLEVLDCSRNKLTALALSGNPKLKTLIFSDNKLEEIDLTGNPELTRLDCTSNELKNLDISGNRKLLSLRCGWNRLTELDVPQDIQLTELYDDHNPFSMRMEFETVTQNGETYAVLKQVPVQAEVTVPDRTEEGIPVRVIGQHAVANNDAIEKLVIPEGVRVIEPWAIRANPNLRCLVLPFSMERIESHAVYGCPELAEVDMNGTEAEIKEEAFFGIKSGVTGEAAVIAYEGWICRELEDGTLEAGEYIGERKAELILPGVLNGKQVTVLGRGVLSNDKGTVEKLVLPEGLVRIEDHACWSQARLREVIFPSTLETIGESAFLQCPALESAILPDSVREIGENAFCDCTALKEVRLSANLEKLGTGAFRNIPAEAPELPERLKDRAGFWYSTGGTRTEAGGEWNYERTGSDTAAVISWAGEGKYPQTVTFPAEADGLRVTAVFLDFDTTRTEVHEAEEKRRAGVRRIVFPEGITTIGASAVRYMRGVTELAIPEGVTVIPHDFTNSLDSLAKLSLPSTLKVIGEYAFTGSGKLKEVRFPEGLERIERNAFSSCGLNRIELPGSLLYVGECAFEGCGGKKFPEVVVHGFRTEFGLGVFGYTWGADKKKTDLYNDVRLEGSGIAPLKITCARGSSADLLYRYNVQKKYLPYGAEGVLTIEAGSEPVPGQLRAEDGIREIVVSEGVERLPDDCFAGLTSVVRVTLPSTLREIGGNAFSGCVSLEEINLPEGLPEIRNGTFRDCRSLKKIRLPESVTRIGDEAFAGCSALEAVNLPDGLKSIGKAAFRQETEPVQYTYMNTRGKKTFSALKTLQLPAGLEEIGEKAFAGCDALTRVTFGKGSALKVIPANTFSLCLHLKELSLPPTVERIGEQAFSDCRGLKKLDLGTSLKEIGNQAFLRCESLSRIAFPDTVETIGGNLFNGMNKKATFICSEGSAMDRYIKENYPKIKVQRTRK